MRRCWFKNMSSCILQRVCVCDYLRKNDKHTENISWFDSVPFVQKLQWQALSTHKGKYDDILYFSHAHIWSKPCLHKSTYCRNYLTKMLQCLVDFRPQPIKITCIQLNNSVYCLLYATSMHALNFNLCTYKLSKYQSHYDRMCMFWKLSHSHECNRESCNQWGKVCSFEEHRWKYCLSM